MAHPGVYLLVRAIQYLQTGRSGEKRQNRLVWRGCPVTEARREGERVGRKGRSDWRGKVRRRHKEEDEKEMKEECK